MRRVGWLFIILMFTVPALSQSPEVDALLDAFLAKDVATVAKHLPPSFQEALSELPSSEQASVGQTLLFGERIRHEGVKIVQNETADVILTIEQERGDTKHHAEIRLEKKVSDGYQSVLRISIRENSGEFQAMFEAWMKYEDGEWRIYEINAGDTHSLLNLDDPKFLEEIRGRHSDAGDASAVGSLRTYNTAIVTYESTYPEVGIPSSFEALGPATGDVPSSLHAGLLDAYLGTPPYRKSGYQFTYHPRSSTDYEITARPIEFGTTGKRSFLTDQTGVIRYTEEDRYPTANDPALQ
jgi:hypothetical protein